MERAGLLEAAAEAAAGHDWTYVHLGAAVVVPAPGRVEPEEMMVAGQVRRHVRELEERAVYGHQWYGQRAALRARLRRAQRARRARALIDAARPHGVAGHVRFFERLAVGGVGVPRTWDEVPDF